MTAIDRDLRETLARIRKQADAATEGPWDYKYGYDTPSEWQDSYVLDADGEPVVSDVSDGNGEFIASARTAVPWLLEQVERRDKMLEDVEALAADLDRAALWAINHPEVDDDLKGHAHADRGIADRIRAILNGETND